MNSQKIYIGIVLFITLTITIFIIPNTDTILSQDDLCPTVVTSAVETTNQFCDMLGENQACYGNVQVEAQGYDDFGLLEFSQPGDVANLQQIQSLQLSPMDTTENVWGMARLEVLANLLLQDFETVTLLLFGDTQIENTVQPTTPIEIEVNVNSYVNVRQVPSTNGAVVGTLAPNDTIQALGRLGDNSWLRVQLPTGGVGWLFSDLATTSEDINLLRVEEYASPYYEPMQAFYLRTDATTTGEVACDSAPPSGLLIQTPEGMGEITFLINEVTVDIGSTVFFQAPVGGPLSITTIEGQARVSVNGSTSIAFAGTTVTVELDENGLPVGTPSDPVPYNLDIVIQLPIEGLEVQITIEGPLTEEEIADLNASTVQANVDINACCSISNATNTTTNNTTTTTDNSGGGNNNGSAGNNETVDNTDNSDDSNDCASFTCLDDNTPDAQPTDPPAMVTICHNPNGNNPNTLTVSWNGWINGHSGHGDILGPCP